MVFTVPRRNHKEEPKFSLKHFVILDSIFNHFIIFLPKMLQKRLVFLWLLALAGTSTGLHSNHNQTEVLLNQTKINFNNLGNEQVRFLLYTRDNPNPSDGIEIFLGLKNHLIASGYNAKAPMKIICYGFNASFKEGPGGMLVPAYLNSTSVGQPLNVITVHWKEMAGGEKVPIDDAPIIVGMLNRRSRRSEQEPLRSEISFLPAKKTELAGNRTGALIKFLVESAGADLKTMHLIGHSLGAHVMGYAGRFARDNLKLTVARITALDPAAPCFGSRNKYLADRILLLGCRNGSPNYTVVGKADADFVDVIHTNAGGLGIDEPVGHADFYPNGGRKQKGCPRGDALKASQCNHRRSVELMRDSIMYPDRKFNAYRCPDWETFLTGKCSTSPYPDAVMGEPCTSDSWGKLYLETRESEPFFLETSKAG